jgi:PAS domain S-box-containing protein
MKSTGPSTGRPAGRSLEALADVTLAAAVLVALSAGLSTHARTPELMGSTPQLAVALAAAVAYVGIRRTGAALLSLGWSLLAGGLLLVVAGVPDTLLPGGSILCLGLELTGLVLVLLGIRDARRRSRDRVAEAGRELAASADRERRLAHLLEQAPVGLFEVDHDGVVAHANRAMHIILGRAPGTLPGFRVSDIGWEEEGRTHADGAMGDRRAVTYRHPDGTDRELELRANAVIGDDGSRVGTLTAVMDVTERNRAERERAELHRRMEQGQRLETIGTLAGGIAHDFNNLLTPILGYVEIAQAEVEQDSVLFEDLAQVAAAGHRAKDLVAQILRFSRPEKEELQPVALQGVAREVTGLLRASLPATVRIVQRMDAACPPVLGKATNIHQILFNLCTNASHAMPEGGTITVSVDLVDALATMDAVKRPAGSGPFVRLRVEDDGTGMDGATLERIFQPFFTTKEVGKGTGLGLAVVQGIVVAMNGTISVESTLGRGSAFTLLFPAHQEVVAEKQAVDEDVPMSAGGRVLLVDDDPGVLGVTARILARLGYEVTSCASGDEAHAVFDETPQAFDVVFTDQTMPGRTGLQLARDVRRRRPDIPIVLTTGYAGVITDEHLRDIGGCELILKPASPAHIGRVVRRALGAMVG